MTIDVLYSVGLAEQAEEIESMYEKRLQLLTQSIKKTVHRKKRKLEEAEFCEVCTVFVCCCCCCCVTCLPYQ